MSERVKLQVPGLTAAIRPYMGEWRLQAACRGQDPDIFHPEQGDSPNPARAICADCTVREECLEWALLSVERRGVWGGLTERERRAIRRSRRRMKETA